MDIRFLSSLIEVVEVGSIAEAARNQNLTPAAISQRIKALESNFGCQLFSRTGHSAKPTEKCLKILPRLHRIISESKGLLSDLNDDDFTGELIVGAISTAMLSILPTVIKNLAKSAPGLKVKIVPGTSASLYRKLTDGKIDIALTVDPSFSSPKYVKQEVIYSEELSLICCEQSNLGIEDIITSQPFIQYDRFSWGGKLVEKYLLDNHLNVSPVCEIDSLESIAIMVKQGMGVSLVPLWKGMEELFGELQVIPIHDERYCRDISLLSHRQIGKETLIDAFSSAVQRHI